MLARLLERLDTATRADDPHLYAEEPPWPGCWCGKPGDAAQHAYQVPAAKGAPS